MSGGLRGEKMKKKQTTDDKITFASLAIHVSYLKESPNLVGGVGGQVVFRRIQVSRTLILSLI